MPGLNRLLPANANAAPLAAMECRRRTEIIVESGTETSVPRGVFSSRCYGYIGETAVPVNEKKHGIRGTDPGNYFLVVAEA